MKWLRRGGWSLFYLWITVLVLVGGRWAAWGQSPAVQWQAVINLINTLQNQLNQIQAKVNASALPAGATACQQPTENSTATAVIWAYLTGDVSTGPGSCGSGSQNTTVQGFRGVPLKSGSPTDGNVYTYKAANSDFELATPNLPVGAVSIANFAASGSANTYTGTTMASGATVNGLSATQDFVPNNGILIPGAGSNCLLNSTACASITPANLTVAVGSGSGATSYCYYAMYTECDSLGCGGHTPASTVSECVNNNVTLSITVNNGGPPTGAWNTITLPAPSVPVVYDTVIYKSVNGGPKEFWYRTVGGQGTVLYDVGQANGQVNNYGLIMTCGYDVPCLAPSTAAPNHYLGQVVTSSGSSLTVTPVTPNSCSACPVLHEDSAAINAAVAAAFAVGNQEAYVFAPPVTAAGNPAHYRLVNGLNFVNQGGAGVSLIGGEGRTTFTCDTNQYACMERYGSSSYEFKNIGMTSGNEDIEPSQIGVVGGANNTATVNGIFGRDENFSMGIYEDQGSHCQNNQEGGKTCLGTVGWWSIGDDAHSAKDIFLNADTPMLSIAFLNSPTISYVAPGRYGAPGKDALGGASDQQFIGQSAFIGGHGAAVTIQGQVRNFGFWGALFAGNCSNCGPPAQGQHPYAIEVGNDVCWGESFNSTWESDRVEEYTYFLRLAGGGAGCNGNNTEFPRFRENRVSPDSGWALDGQNLPVFTDVTYGGGEQQHFIQSNDFKLIGSDTVGILGFKNGATNSSTIFQGNTVEISAGVKWDNSFMNAAGVTNQGGNIYHLGTHYGSVPDSVVESSLYSGGDLVCGQGSCQDITGTEFQLDGGGHFSFNVTGAILPTLTVCGVGASFTNSSAADQAGRVTTGSGTTTCTINFANNPKPFAKVPACTCADETRAVGLQCTPSTTQLVIAGFTASDVVDYTCTGLEIAF